jgi:hypothetical protein
VGTDGANFEALKNDSALGTLQARVSKCMFGFEVVVSAESRAWRFSHV